jgi:hypothetical protein
MTMPWPAIPHIDSVGPRGDSLMSLYGITTLPALVLLDGTGTVVCQDGRAKVVNRQAGRGSTPTNPRQPVPDCDLPAAARQRPTGSTCRRIRDWTSNAQQDQQGCHRRSMRQQGTHRQWHPGWAGSPPCPWTQLSIEGHPPEPTWTHRQTPHHLCGPQRKVQRSGCPQSQTCHRGRYLQRDPR